MGDPEKVVDQPVKEWVARTRELLKAAREKPRAVADDSGLDRSRIPQDTPPSTQGRQMDLANADPATAARVKRAAELKRQIGQIVDPDEASSDEAKSLHEARIAALGCLDVAPLTEGALANASQGLERLQAAVKAAAAAILKRMRARVADLSKPLADPSLTAPADAEGAEWKPVQDAVALASQTQQSLLQRDPLPSLDIEPLAQQVGAALDARDLARQAIQQRLRAAAALLLAKVDPPGLQRLPDASDIEWTPVADLVTDLHGALDKPVLKGDDLRAAETRLKDLNVLLRDARTAVRERLVREADAARIKVNLALSSFAKQRKNKLGAADAFELKIVDSQVQQLEALTQPKTMTGSQIAQSHQAVDSLPTLLANVQAMGKARDLLAAARLGLHGDVRKVVIDGGAASPAVLAHEKLRADVAADPATDRTAALATAAQDAVSAVLADELTAMKAELERRCKAAGVDIKATMQECAEAVHASSKDPVRKSFVAGFTTDPELMTLSAALKDLWDKLPAANGYDAGVASIPVLQAAAKRRVRQMLAEHTLAAALSTTPSDSGKTAMDRMTLLRGIRSDLNLLERNVRGVQAAGLTLPSTVRVLDEIDKLSDLLDGAQAATLEADCHTWRIKVTRLRESFDADVTALRLARATAPAGAKYLKVKCHLLKSGGVTPQRGVVEAAIGKEADLGHTLGAWGYTWDVLQAEMRLALKDGRLTQTQLDALTGGSGGQRYVDCGNHHISVSFTKEDDLYCVTGLHVSLEGVPEAGRPRYWFSVTDGVIVAKPSVQGEPNPSGYNVPANYSVTATNLVNNNKSRYNCR